MQLIVVFIVFSMQDVGIVKYSRSDALQLCFSVYKQVESFL